MYHYIKTKNLPYSLDEVRKMTASCKICAEIKPKFFKPPQTSLIKATQPVERFSIDFKGPLPSASKSKYILILWLKSFHDFHSLFRVEIWTLILLLLVCRSSLRCLDFVVIFIRIGVPRLCPANSLRTWIIWGSLQAGLRYITQEEMGNVSDITKWYGLL